MLSLQQLVNENVSLYKKRIKVLNKNGTKFKQKSFLYRQPRKKLIGEVKKASKI